MHCLRTKRFVLRGRCFVKWIAVALQRVRTAQSIVQRLYTRHQYVTSEYKKQLRAIKSNLKDTKVRT